MEIRYGLKSDWIYMSSFSKNVHYTLFKLKFPSSLEEAEKALDGLFDQALSGTLEKRFYLYSASPGLGKTTKIINLLKRLKSSSRTRRGILICLSRIEEFKTYVNSCGLTADDYSIFTSEPNAKGLQAEGFNVDGPDDAWVLFTTHQMIEKRLRDKGFSAATCFYYRGEPRPLRIWDEGLDIAKNIVVTLDNLKALPAAMRKDFPAFVGRLEDFVIGAEKAPVDGILNIPTALHTAASTALKSVAMTGVDQKNRDILEDLISLSPNPVLKGFENDIGSCLVGCSKPLPDDLAPLLIFDASGDVRATYSLWEKHRSDLHRLEAPKANYTNLQLHVWDRPSGQKIFGNGAALAEIVKAAAAVINAKPHEEWLVIHHKSNWDRTEKALKTALTNPSCFRSIYWGNHHGTNAYRSIKNVVVLGVQGFRTSVYKSMFLASSGLNPAAMTPADIEAVKGGELQHSLLQAICRSNVRNQDRGICGEATVYVIATPSYKVSGHLKTAFPGAALSVWAPVPTTLAGQAKAVADELIRRFSTGEVSIAKGDIRKALGMTKPQSLTQVLNRKDFQKFCADEHILIDSKAFKKVVA